MDLTAIHYSYANCDTTSHYKATGNVAHVERCHRSYSFCLWKVPTVGILTNGMDYALLRVLTFRCQVILRVSLAFSWISSYVTIDTSVSSDLRHFTEVFDFGNIFIQYSLQSTTLCINGIALNKSAG